MNDLSKAIDAYRDNLEEEIGPDMGGVYTAGYCNGFDKAAALLMPAIEASKEILGTARRGDLLEPENASSAWHGLFTRLDQALKKIEYLTKGIG